ncbi:hypothetical protein BGZ63DRAFT_391890, partial [Mariannaea sp. PMI_226]
MLLSAIISFICKPQQKLLCEMAVWQQRATRWQSLLTSAREVRLGLHRPESRQASEAIYCKTPYLSL